jgi:hypothetical protein
VVVVVVVVVGVCGGCGGGGLMYSRAADQMSDSEDHGIEKSRIWIKNSRIQEFKNRQLNS